MPWRVAVASRNSPSLPWQRFDRNRESHRQTPKGLKVGPDTTRNQHMSATRRALLERREQLGRHREWQKQNMTKMVDMDAAMRCNIASDSRVDNIRRVREEKNRLQQEQQQQTEMQLKLQRANRLRQLQDDAERLKKENEARTTIARQEKLRQSICENSHELRELEQKLNDAYTSKERALQMQEKILELERHKAREYELTEQLQRQLEQDRQIELEMEKGRHIYQQEYQAALHGQLEDLERRKQVEYEMFLREKAMVDEIVRQINEQDEMEARRHLEKQKETKQYIEDFMEERRLWNEMEREKTEAENRKIVEYARLQSEREQQKQEKKKTQDTARTAIYDKLAAEMAEQERAKQELEDLRLELDREEQEEFERQKDMEILQSRIRKRLELIDAYQKQMQFKRVRQQKEREQEESFREKMLRKFAEDEKIELMNDQRRRMKQLEHRRAVDLLIDERRRMAEAERLEELEIERRQAELEEYKKAVVEQERQRLLREHAAKLIGYLPKGVLRDQRDLDLFDEDFRRRFQIHSQPYEIS